jgi:hypothetical protein
MPTRVGFSRFAALLEEQISEKISRRILSGDQGMIVWWSIGAGVHVEPHSHANEQIAWMLKGKMEFRLGSEQRVCGPGDVWNAWRTDTGSPCAERVTWTRQYAMIRDRKALISLALGEMTPSGANCANWRRKKPAK